MKKEKKRKFSILWFITFSFFFVTLILLFSYKMVWGFTSLNPDQKETIGFLKNGSQLNINYEKNEILHLQDVKKVMTLIDYIFYFSLLVVSLVITRFKQNKKILKKLLIYGNISLLIVVLLFFLFNFNGLFEIFHQIFFPQGNWIFPIDSLLIKIFPVTFFIEISRNIFLLASFIGVLTLVILLLKSGENSERFIN